jgi:outer membrane lipoprotein SlyB
MIKAFLRTLLLVGMGIAILACASPRPVLAPNAHLEAVDRAAAQQDVDDCLRWAREGGQGARQARQVAGSTALGGATGAAVGAASGAVFGNAGRGAAAGAAGGATAGLIRGLLHSHGHDLSPEQRRLVEQCLRNKGYEISGWE